MTKVYKTSAVTVTSRLSNGFEGMSFPATTGPDGGWSLAHNGSGKFDDFEDTTGTNKEGSISLHHIEADVNSYGVFRSITATRTARIEFYHGVYSAGARSGGTVVECQIDDGDSTDTMLGGASNPANALYVSAAHDHSTDVFTVTVKYRFSSGSVTTIKQYNTDITMAGSTTQWVGVRVDITNTLAKIYLDVNDNDIFELYNTTVWTSPFSSTPFNQTRADTIDEGPGTDESVIDSVEIATIAINTGNEITTIKNVTSSNKLDGAGTVQFVFIDHDYSELATIQGYMLLDVVITDDNSDTVFFNGQFLEWDFHPDGFALTALEGLDKLSKYQANFNPVRLPGAVAWIDDTEIRNEDIDFSGNNGYPIMIEQVSPFKSVAFPKTYLFFESDGTTPYTPKDIAAATEQGDVDNLSIFDANYPRGSIGSHALGAYSSGDAGGGSTFDEWIIQLTCPMYYKENSTISSLSLHLVFSLGATSELDTNKIVKTAEDARIQIYNYDSTSWETLETLQNEDVATDVEEITHTSNHKLTTPITKVYTSFADSTLNNYKDTGGEGAANSNGWIETDFRFRIQAFDGGVRGDLIADVWLFEAFFEITWDNEQTILVSSSDISTSADNTVTLDDNLEIEGIARGDNFFITETITTTLDNVWTQSGINSLYTLDRDATDDRGDNEDLTYKTVRYVLQKYKDLGYYFWQYDDIVRMKKSFISSGLTLTEADVYNYVNTRLGIKASYKKMRNQIILIGGNNINIPKDVSPNIANVFVELIERSDVKNQSIAQEIVDNLVTTIYKEPNYFGSIVLDWDKGTDYSAARVGTTIAYTDSQSILDFSGGGTTGEELIITELHTFRQNNRNLVRLIVTLNAE